MGEDAESEKRALRHRIGEWIRANPIWVGFAVGSTASLAAMHL